MKAFNFTAWGYQDCQYDPQDGSFGGLLTKLLFRTLPDYYPTGSAYAHFPFLDPVYMKKNMEETDPDLAAKYTWTRPRPYAPTVPIETFAGVQQVLKGPDFVSAYDKRLFTAVKPILTKEIVGFFCFTFWISSLLMHLDSKGIDQMKRVLMHWMKPKRSLTMELPLCPSPYFRVWTRRPWLLISRRKLKS